MNGKFVTTADIEWEHLDWGDLGWICRPHNTGASQITLIHVKLKPGGGHDFHLHPKQEETITVIAGEIEQWLESERRTLSVGDTIFIGAGVVHASFNVSKKPAEMMVTLGPCDGETGYVVEDVSDQAPWNSLR